MQDWLVNCFVSSWGTHHAEMHIMGCLFLQHHSSAEVSGSTVMCYQCLTPDAGMLSDHAAGLVPTTLKAHFG